MTEDTAAAAVAAPVTSSRTEDAAGLEQQIQLTVRGGQLSVSPSSLTFTVDPASGPSALPRVDVVDARGTLEGWQLRARVTARDSSGKIVPPGHVRLIPTGVTVVAGSPDGLAIGDGGPGRAPRLILQAAHGEGGGTYVPEAEVVINPRRVDGPITMTIEFDVD